MYTDEKFGVPGSARINPIEWDEHTEVNGIGRKKVTIVGVSGDVADVTVDGKLKVDATVTATIDPSGLATSANQTNGNQKTKLVDKDGEVAEIVANPNTNSPELLVNLEGHECIENTTSTPLIGGGVFLGSGWQDTKDYGVLSINVFSDKASATDGLEIQWSHDGITPYDYDRYTIAANSAKTYTFGPAERYYRIKYTNGAIAQTTFHLTSILRRSYVKPSSHRVGDVIVAEDDSELVKSVIIGETTAGHGDYVNVKVNPSGALTTESTISNTTADPVPVTLGLPTAGTNPSETITEVFADNTLTTTLEKVIAGTTYTKTIVENYTTGITTESSWS